MPPKESLTSKMTSFAVFNTFDKKNDVALKLVFNRNSLAVKDLVLLGFACLMLGKTKNILPNDLNDGLMVIYHGTIR